MADFMSPEARSRIMASIRSTNTKPEKLLGSLMFKAGLRYRKYLKDLPGRPDFVFSTPKVVVFVDGDFWHGWRYPQWEHKMEKPYWKEKIRKNRARDKKNHSKLRRMGWKVIRVWEHQLEDNPENVLARIVHAVRDGKKPQETSS